MLQSLRVRNLAVIDTIELEFSGGLTVLTGETGAGKSILVDALALALGQRADSRVLRAGSDRCEIAAVFGVEPGSALQRWLEEQDLEAGEECLLRRVITAEGRSRGYLNGQPVTMQTLQTAGEHLLEICGQQAHQRLRHRAAQRELLDHFGGHRALLGELQQAHAAWRTAGERLAALSGDEAELAARQELLGFQLRELEALNLADGEYEALAREARRLDHATRIAEGLQASLDAAYAGDEFSAHALAARSRRQVEALAELDPELEGPAGLLAEAEVLLVEAAEGLRQGLARNEYDPQRAQAVADRVAEARALARKHLCEPGELPAVRERLSGELAGLAGRDQQLGEAEVALARCRAQLLAAADRLTRAREAAAKALAKAVTENMQQLGMAGGRFAVRLDALPEDRVSAQGAERVEFLVTTNPGQPPGPLSRVASGGELSRIGLALQVVAAGDGLARTLVFDEVDAGVGGATADIVGRQLGRLAGESQVLCVTHLPQVACHADQHIRVSKLSDGQRSHTRVTALTREERVEEIARMLGGLNLTARSRAHAREMLQAAAEWRRAG
ncbi:MAG: DNA repair protein RecN [Gammaproteobacteria bacterium]|nr:MAG: DNA repair protein RecN [Gammaproteobacteria bacterium]